MSDGAKYDWADGTSRLIQVVICMQGIFKLGYYLRIYKSFAQIIQLLYSTWNDLIVFTSVFVYLVVVFALIYRELGID